MYLTIEKRQGMETKLKGEASKHLSYHSCIGQGKVRMTYAKTFVQLQVYVTFIVDTIFDYQFWQMHLF